MISEEEARNNCIEKFSQIIKNKEIVNEIEKGIYQYTVNKVCVANNMPVNWDNKMFKRQYMNKCISIYSNLDDKSYVGNKSLLNRVLEKEIDPYQLAFLTPQELFPEHWKPLIDKKIAKDDFLYTKKHEAHTEEYTCGRCKKNKCSFYELQIRSGDEPSTIFVTCLNCGKKWQS